MSLKNASPLRVLHLAAFSGNIGDIANHQGFYKQFTKTIPATFTSLELRRFYKNRSELAFNEAFVEMVNQYDLLVLGGGGFFDLRWDASHTGTTMDFSEQLIQDIKVPVLVNAMGYHEFEDVQEAHVKTFNTFLTRITQHPRWFVSVRNDGSYARMQARYGKSMERVLRVPDHGFFFAPQHHDLCQLEDANTLWIGVNITNDLFSKRFNHELNTERFNVLMSDMLRRMLQERPHCKLILFPHTHQDVETIGTLLRMLEDKYKRERIVVAPLFVEGASVEHVFSLYRLCSAVVAMRFHASVCCIGMQIPTVGLAGHEQISSLYEELGLQEWCVKADREQFANDVLERVNQCLAQKDAIQERYTQVMHTLSEQSDLYLSRVKQWLAETAV